MSKVYTYFVVFYCDVPFLSWFGTSPVLLDEPSVAKAGGTMAEALEMDGVREELILLVTSDRSKSGHEQKQIHS